MCKDGQMVEAQKLAQADIDQHFPWAHREMAWVIYYQIKADTSSADFQSLIAHLDVLQTLDQLTMPYDNLIFEKLLFQLSLFVKTHLSPTDATTPEKLSQLFLRLLDYHFEPSRSYSFLLQSVIKCSGWHEMADFILWWDLSKLSSDDYVPFRMDNGRTIMSLAERAYIAMSKTLLATNNRMRIEDFLPSLSRLNEQHPEMTYPGYFYGKLLLALGNSSEEALAAVLPFVRKKVNEFWAWQLLSDVFPADSDEHLACLLRAVHCRTQEKFLGKIRMRLITLFVNRKMYGLAKYQIEKLSQCYAAQGWHLPYEVEISTHQPWYSEAHAQGGAPLDYSSITGTILCKDTNEAVAIVTWFDSKSKKSTLVYGRKLRVVQKLPIKSKVGDVLKIHYTEQPDHTPSILSAKETSLVASTDYAKLVEGVVKKRSDKDFAFLKTSSSNYFIAPPMVRQYHLQDGDRVRCLVAFDYNTKKQSWNWTCIKPLK